MNRSTYLPISQVGSNTYEPVNNPLTYCLNNEMDQRFMHGGHADTMGQHSRQCQLFLSEYCSDKWDGFCELASQNTNTKYPNNMQQSWQFGDTACRGLNAGEILIRNTAARKYLISMGNCEKKYEPFDPTVATSPLISYWSKDQGAQCIPMYAVDPNNIDSDVVMDKILSKPIIAIDILINIFNTMKRLGTLSQLQGTKLAGFYMANEYFKSKGGL